MGDTLPCVATLRHVDAGPRRADEQGLTVSTWAAVTHATRATSATRPAATSGEAPPGHPAYAPKGGRGHPGGHGRIGRMTDTPATTTSRIPERPTLDGLEAKWMQVWADEGTYAFDREKALALPREQVFAIDTPPPTASGSLHVGHVFSYTHTDCMARYKRMQGL